MTSCDKPNFFSLESLLLITSSCYNIALNIRQSFYNAGIIASRTLSCKVISIGNITVGGTGKTPMTIYVVRLLQQLGYKVAVVSRGYKGSEENRGSIVSDGSKIFLGPDASGDEPFMMANMLKNVPVAVGQKRFDMGKKILKLYKPDVLVLDDAFQHRQLNRDMDLVLLDYSCPFGNKHLVPRGVLREPVSSLSRADAVIITRSNQKTNGYKSLFCRKAEKKLQPCPVFYSCHNPYVFQAVKKNSYSDQKKNTKSYDFTFLKGQKVVAFSGIACNGSFRQTVAEIGCIITEFLEFSDHYFYLEKDFNKISRISKKSDAKYLLTTQKDYMRIYNKVKWPVDLVVIGVEISFGKDEPGFISFIKNYLD